MGQPSRLLRSHTAILISAGLALVGGQSVSFAACESETSTSCLEKISVSARKIPQAEQDVPVSTHVVSGETLAKSNIYQAQELPQLLPNFSVQFFQPRQTSFGIRGIGNNPANDGLEGSVGVYLDNVYLGRPGQAMFDLLDIEQIELLRGPQGTLFGKNTTAGVLNIQTRAPSFTPEHSVQASFGERDFRQFKASLSQGINDVAAFRVSAYETKEDGWIKNLFNGRNTNSADRAGIRAQLLLVPNTDSSYRIILEHNNEDSSAGRSIPYRYGPWNIGQTAGNLPIGAPGSNATTLPQHAALLGATGIILDPQRYEVNVDTAQRTRVDQSAISMEANWELGAYKLTSISAWRDWKYRPQVDLDTTNLFAVNGGFFTDEQQFTQELRLSSPDNQRHQYQVGAYYYFQDIDSRNDFQSGPSALALTGAFPNNRRLTGTADSTRNSFALFGQSVTHVTEQFDITAGLRHTTEHVEARVIQNEVMPAFPVSPLFQFYDSGKLSRTDSSWSTLLTASYRHTPHWMSFATLSSGEKSGGYNLNNVTSPGSVLGNAALDIEPEKATNVEIGFKTAWLQDRIRFNATAFVSKVRDYQAVTNTQVANTFVGLLTNVGDLTSKGVEFDLRAKATPSLTMSLSGAYTDATFDSGTAPTPFETFNGPGGTPDSGYGKGFRSIAGNRVNNAPRFSYQLGAQSEWYLNGTTRQYAHAYWSWQSSTYGDINNSTYSRIPSYGLLNLSTGLAFKTRHGVIDVSAWIKNALDERYFPSLFNLGSGVYLGYAGMPRTAGFTMRYDF
ncbi:TonB-dependent receptor [Pseudomethylobacillus aquaticus]|uniref:TonB-dependent receptor n=1 Tax=Pseudomethylobacillus aquaticus TaxID=2676064 RepID=A0A3N0UWE3_9PROT|nr:TonB-dependent receptor [Pseudomethylobacillus aquaticus]